MIIDKEIFVNITNRNKKFYTLKGYTCNDDNLKVDIKDIPNNSHILINVRCDNCGCSKKSIYKNYYNITNGFKEKYYCERCKHIKVKNTNIDKYGVSSSFSRNDVKKKIKNKLIEKFGVDHPLKSDNIKNKMINNLIDKYGVDNISKIKEIKDKKNNSLKKSWVKRLSSNYSNLKIVEGNYDDRILKINCDLNKNHVFDIKLDLLHNRKEFGNVLCTICNPINSNRSSHEDLIYEFIKTNYNGNIILNDRNSIKPFEIDIYLPELNIGFDINGLHWHNDLKKDKNYHKLKTDLSTEKNIHLIQFYEDDIINKLSIIKSMILNKLNKIENKIYARKCEIREINNNKIIKDFLNKNHIQGHIGSSIKIGLFYNSELVSLMTFGKRKFLNNDDIEIIRFCNKLNTVVVGGASKIFNYFNKKYSFNKIITFADKSYSNGNLYENMGFEELYHTKPNYYYIYNRKRKHRFNFRKDVLVKLGYDSSKTEKEIMNELRINRIYDSGSIKYQYLKNNKL